MSGRIFLISENGGLTALGQEPYETEGKLQELMDHYPDLIPDAQVDPNDSR